MMVDTINPDTGGQDKFPTAAVPAGQPQAADGSTDRFYGGFDKPDEVNINLAAAGGTQKDGFSEPAPESAELAKQVGSSAGMNDMKTPAPQVPGSSTESQIHSTYTSKTPVNTRGILVIVGIGIAAALIFSAGTFFLLGSSNAEKVKNQQAQLDEINGKLAGLTETPAALTVPEVVTPPTTEPVVEPTAPAVTPVETPVESTQTTTPEATTDTNTGETAKNAAG